MRRRMPPVRRWAWERDPVSADPAGEDRVWTIPNVISFLRLLGVPLFLWLALGPAANGWALLVLVVAGISDYLDGKIARRFGQTSRLGTLLDPAADRLYILATVAALTDLGVLPIWLACFLVGRDVVLAAMVPVLRRRGYGVALPVNFIGKAATTNLLYAFPLLLLATGSGGVAALARPVGWAFTCWGVGLYWFAGLIYLDQIRRLPDRSGRRPAAAVPTATTR
jgi:CDP-diacylglycerol--glycerol-3-phosphate 3-phosphatidyltransferase